MDFTLSEEQTMMIETARRVGEKFGLDYWRDLDEKAEFPAEIWQAICDAGLCGVALPEQHGGAGLGMLDLALVIETLCETGGGATLAQIFMTNPIFGGVAISKHGTDKMRAELLPRLISGDMNCSMGLTEPNAGSNSLMVTTFAAKTDTGWLLNGRKIWITAVPQAEKMLVVARTKKLEDSERRTDGLSLFLVDVEREGLTHSSIPKVGTRTLPSSLVYFDDVKVGSEELVGPLHGGWRCLLDVLNTERIVTTAGLVGAGRLAKRIAVDYACERKVFGDRPIGSYQGLSFPLAQAWSELECARIMNYNAASNFDTGGSYGSESNMGKLIASQAASRLIEQAMQIMGGMGYAKESHLERLWRDARLFRFAPVSEEMLLNFIAQHDLGMPRSY
jgi:acyl-CoA dehydrogenase